MFCPQCGSQNSNNATTCAACGATLGNPYQSSMAGSGSFQPGPNIPSYLPQAILSTICCCLPFGIVAIVYAAQVSSKLAVGDFEGARRSSDSAKMWCWVAFGIGIAWGIIVMIVQMGFIGMNQHFHR
jgi:uncharacterized membrane protein YvbJ